MKKGDVKWELQLNTSAAKDQTRNHIHFAVIEIFELDIKPQAQRDTPYKTGKNRRSIDCDVDRVPQGTAASIYTQSGYGGYLEVGTRKMAARPYIYPAFMSNRAKLEERIKRRFDGRQKG